MKTQSPCSSTNTAKRKHPRGTVESPLCLKRGLRGAALALLVRMVLAAAHVLKKEKKEMTPLSLANSCCNKQHTLTNCSEGLWCVCDVLRRHLLGPLPLKLTPVIVVINSAQPSGGKWSGKQRSNNVRCHPPLSVACSCAHLCTVYYCRVQKNQSWWEQQLRFIDAPGCPIP